MNITAVITMPSTPNTKVNLFEAITGQVTASGFACSVTLPATGTSRNGHFLQIRAANTNTGTHYVSYDSRVSTTPSHYHADLTGGQNYSESAGYAGNCISLTGIYIVGDVASETILIAIRIF